MTGKLQFKFVQEAGDEAREALTEKLHDRGALEVRPLFPGEKNPELAAIRVVEYRGDRNGGRLLRYLKRSKLVEFAEGQITRKLIK